METGNKLMNVLKTILAVILTAIAVLMLLFTVGTVFPALPAFGSVAGFVTVAFIHLWLPLSIVFFLGFLLLSVWDRTRTKLYLADLAMVSVTLVITAVIAIVISGSVKRFGVSGDLFPSKADVSSVITQTEVYTTSELGDVELNIYYADDGVKGKPVVLYFHGGGWIFGDKDNKAYYSKVFAKNGYVVFSADYDLSSEDRHLATSTETQLLEAVAWVGNHAAYYGGDISRFYLTGGSAGGNLALEVAYKINAGVYKTSSDGTELPLVDAVSVTFPAASVEDVYRNDDLILGSTAHRMAAAYTGCSPEEDPALYESIDPVCSVTSLAPPTLLFLGEGDTLVPPGATFELAELLSRQRVPCRLIAVPFGNHMLEMAEGGMLCNAYLETTMRWFDIYR